MSAALSASRMLAEALAYSRMRWRWRTLSRAAAVRVARRRLSRGLCNDAIDAFQPLQPRLDIRGGERAAKGVHDLRQLKGLVGRDAPSPTASAMAAIAGARSAALRNGSKAKSLARCRRGAAMR